MANPVPVISWILPESPDTTEKEILAKLTVMNAYDTRHFVTVWSGFFHRLPNVAYNTTVIITHTIDDTHAFVKEFFPNLSTRNYEVIGRIVTSGLGDNPNTWVSYCQNSNNGLMFDQGANPLLRMTPEYQGYSTQFFEAFKVVPDWKILLLEWKVGDEIFKQSFINVEVFLDRDDDPFINSYFAKEVSIICYHISSLEMTVCASHIKDFVTHWRNKEENLQRIIGNLQTPADISSAMKSLARAHGFGLNL